MAAQGIYVQKTSSGAIYGVRIRDEGNDERSVTASQYAAGDYEPPLSELPSIHVYFATRRSENG